MQARSRFPGPKDAEAAREAARRLSKVLRTRGGKGIKVQASGDRGGVSAVVPREAFRLFLEILEQMADGSAVNLMPLRDEVTTQEAADLMRVSRPFLVQLLDEGKIPHRLVGTHRRIRTEDLLSYMEKDERKRAAVLEELAAEAQKRSLGY